MANFSSLHSLDEAGYFIISADGSRQEIVAQYYPNTINAAGVPLLATVAACSMQSLAGQNYPRFDSPAGEACDPDTGEVIPCGPGYTRPPKKIFRLVSQWSMTLSAIACNLVLNSRCTHLVHNYNWRSQASCCAVQSTVPAICAGLKPSLTFDSVQGEDSEGA